MAGPPGYPTRRLARRRGRPRLGAAPTGRAPGQAAGEDPGGRSAGRPGLAGGGAADVIVFKRSMATGYAGVQNPLFFRDNTQMLFGDAKDKVEDIIRAL